MTDLDHFQELLTKEGIKYFTAEEVFFKGGSDSRLKLNSHPPKELWPKIIPTLKVLDQLRQKVGRLKITSGYRNQAYNRAIGGEKNSYHQHFIACDVIPLDAGVVTLWKAASELRKQGGFKGGLGRYSSFVHVDTRGYNATW